MTTRSALFVILQSSKITLPIYYIFEYHSSAAQLPYIKRNSVPSISNPFYKPPYNYKIVIVLLISSLKECSSCIQLVILDRHRTTNPCKVDPVLPKRGAVLRRGEEKRNRERKREKNSSSIDHTYTYRKDRNTWIIFISDSNNNSGEGSRVLLCGNMTGLWHSVMLAFPRSK